MAEWYTDYKITNADKAEMLAAANWIATNHGAKVQRSQANRNRLEITVGLLDLTFNDAVATINALETEFTTRIEDWNLTMQ